MENFYDRNVVFIGDFNAKSSVYKLEAASLGCFSSISISFLAILKQIGDGRQSANRKICDAG
jgi:hypothetical protein